MTKFVSVRGALASCALMVIAATALGCKEKQASPQQATQASESAAKPVERTTRYEVVLYCDKDGNNTPLYVEDKDGKMVWADEAIPGDAIYAYESAEDSERLEEKNAVRRLSNGKEEAMDFVHVRYYDKDYWTRPIFITGKRHLRGAAVTADTYIYSTTDLVNAKTTKVEKGTFVAFDTSEEIDGIQFAHIFFYDWNTPYGKLGYIKLDALATSELDVKDAQTERAFAHTKDLKPFVRDEVISILEELREI